MSPTILPFEVLLESSNLIEPNGLLEVCKQESIPVESCSIQELAQHGRLLLNGALPIGSVDFVREAMRVIGLTEPTWCCYPSSLQEYFFRTIQKGKRREIVDVSFVKPVQHKMFHGFVFDPDDPLDPQEVHSSSQLNTMRSLCSESEFWIAEPVEFLAEWRYYVADGHLIGRVRYDTHLSDSSLQPSPTIVADAVIKAWRQIRHSFAIDMGVLSNGKTAVVAVSDAWSVSMHKGALRPKDHLKFLQSRWGKIICQTA
jgi:ATP-grasp domain, R2K clade family 3